ncbi:MAG: NAD-dependent epimerase/dehydratase family protein [Actinobacteria bacterium]|nr:NAD-dependent epimerase/dehydratase family protein [Thermoleophilia bacterium]MCB9011189.1 NAD-dependent epimerase/dehydratase family protein [Actinomycetota bacterium]
MRVVVTGAAGFIGSHLSEYMLAAGHELVGVDGFTPFYGRDAKEANLEGPLSHDDFSFVEADLRSADLSEIVRDADVIVHLAAQPGVRHSWGDQFEVYTGHNLVATQRVLEAAVVAGVPRLVFASSSSIYGSAETMPTPEDVRPKPISPYGVTKLAGESLLHAYSHYGLSTAALRYFTVYGPRQRPDMAIRRFLTSAMTGASVPLFGTGEQRRDFTFVSDIVAATAAIAEGDMEGPFNIGGTNPVSLNELFDTISDVLGRQVNIDRQPALTGDPPSTSSCVQRARDAFGYEPKVGLTEGLTAAADWLEDVLIRDAEVSSV